MGFQVYCQNFSILGTSKVGVGEINHPISMGSVVVNPGDYILGDDDGLVVIKQEDIEDVIKKSKERDAKEEKIMVRLKAGESLFDIYNYQETFDKLNISVEE